MKLSGLTAQMSLYETTRQYRAALRMPAAALPCARHSCNRGAAWAVTEAAFWIAVRQTPIVSITATASASAGRVQAADAIAG